MKTKFRAISVKKQDFIYGDLVYDAINNPRIVHKDISGKGLIFNECVKDSEGQFVGFIDENNVEIYEGDLINIGAPEFGYITDGNGGFVQYEVKYDYGEFILFRTDIKLNWGRISRLKEIGWKCRVVGNIHQNV